MGEPGWITDPDALACLLTSAGFNNVDVQIEAKTFWYADMQPFPLALGALTLVLCAYLAALYLALVTRGNVREDFRRRGLSIGLAAGVVSVFTLVLLIADARACGKDC